MSRLATSALIRRLLALSQNEVFAFLVILATGSIFTIPTALWGFTGGDTIHLIWSKHFAEQLRAGELYPRWLQGMNSGLGSPTFVAPDPHVLQRATFSLQDVPHMATCPDRLQRAHDLGNSVARSAVCASLQHVDVEFLCRIAPGSSPSESASSTELIVGPKKIQGRAAAWPAKEKDPVSFAFAVGRVRQPVRQ